MSYTGHPFEILHAVINVYIDFCHSNDFVRNSDVSRFFPTQNFTLNTNEFYNNSNIPIAATAIYPSDMLYFIYKQKMNIQLYR